MRILFLSVCLLAPLAAAAQETPGADNRLLELERRIQKLEEARPKVPLNAFNPALGAALDMVFRHDNENASTNGGNFLFRAAELNLQAPVDPYVKGWAILVGSNAGVEAEEAALQTTALPWNLTVTGGRMFASFGRLGHFHDHELPVVDRPKSLEDFLGGESRADGIEISYLFPAPFYLNAVAGAYNKLGAENTRASDTASRHLDHFTYLGRLNTYAELGADHSVELGVSSAWTPKRTSVEDTSATGSAAAPVFTRGNTWRALGGVDLTYRYQPSSGGLYKGVDWGTEALVNNERRISPTTKLPTDRVRAFAGYSYVQVRLGRRWRTGVMLDLTEDPDAARTMTSTASAFLTWYATEFQRLRLTGSRENNNVPGRDGNTRVSLQWTGVLGRHVHGFRDR